MSDIKFANNFEQANWPIISRIIPSPFVKKWNFNRQAPVLRDMGRSVNVS